MQKFKKTDHRANYYVSVPISYVMLLKFCKKEVINGGDSVYSRIKKAIMSTSGMTVTYAIMMSSLDAGTEPVELGLSQFSGVRRTSMLSLSARCR